MKDSQSVLRIHLYGPFRIEDNNAKDFTPSSAKICGLIALLALNPHGRHSRSWLQDKLWSSRAKEQGAASLRQSLSQLRRDLGAMSDILVTTRSTVSLDLSRVELISRDEAGYPAELLEGIDVRDAEFEAWLRQERSRHATPIVQSSGRSPPAPTCRKNVPRSVFLCKTSEIAGPERLFEELFIDCLEKSISESLVADVFRRAPGAECSDPVVVMVQAFPAGGNEFGLRLSIEEGPRRRALWSGNRIVAARGAPPVEHVEVLSLVHEATEVLADGLFTIASRNREALDAAILGRLAVRKIFTMNAAQLIEADQILSQAYELDPRAIFLAWKVQLRVIQRMERHVPLVRSADSDVQELVARALAIEPGNSMVLAAAANSLVLIDDDMASGIELARRSLSQNSANPFAWDCLSIGLLMEGKAEEAHDFQLRACALSTRSPIRHFWDMGACLTSVVTGRIDAALRLAHSASVLVPEFRPPLRYMTALNAVNGDFDRAMQSVEKLLVLESDFSVEQMAEDQTYPVAALRRSGLLTDGRFRSLVG